MSVPKSKLSSINIFEDPKVLLQIFLRKVHLFKQIKTVHFFIEFPGLFLIIHHTAQKMKFSIKDFFSKCDQIRILMENFIFCAAPDVNLAVIYYSRVLLITQI